MLLKDLIFKNLNSNFQIFLERKSGRNVYNAFVVEENAPTNKEWKLQESQKAIMRY